MDTPLIISGAGHLGLIAILLFGGLFTPPSDPNFTSAEVTVLSEEEFALLTRPEAGDPAPEAAPPPAEETAEDAIVVPEPGGEEPAPPVPPAPAPEPDPEPELQPAPEPQPLPEPEPDPAPALDPVPPAPEPDLPQAERSVPDAAPRVAPDPSPEPPLEAEEAPEPETAVVPDPAPPQDAPAEERAPAAPPEATSQIVTEAEEPATPAPSRSGRPRMRPDRVALAEPEPEPEPEPSAAPQTEGRTATARSDAVEEALADALAGLERQAEQGEEAADTPAGPPLTDGERDAFRVQVNRCWNVDVGSESADVTVTVAFDMTPGGQVVSASIRQVGAAGGSPAAQRSAYESGRRAILRCQAENGGRYDLPADKYDRWDEVEVVFDPTGMRVR